MDPVPNVLTSAELKRRGMAAIEQALLRGPVRLLKRNQATAVVISEQHFHQLQAQAAQASEPGTPALQWLINLPPASQPLSKTALDSELASERDW